MSAPAPGSIPISDPIIPERIACHLRIHNRGRLAPKTERTDPASHWLQERGGESGAVAWLPGVVTAESKVRILRKTSETPNRPIMAGMKLIP